MHGVVIFGVTGRMGQALVRLLTTAAPEVADWPRTLSLSAGTCRPGSDRLNRDAAGDSSVSGILATNDVDAALRGAGVALDFSRPDLVAVHAEACVRAGVPLLVGTTGFDSSAQAALEAAARKIPVLIAANTSLAVAVMTRLVRLAAMTLGSADVEIHEAHHRAKRDAPSGTALELGRVVAQARGATLQEVAVFDRHGTFAPRVPGSIGFSVLRAADIVGEHTVVFAAAGERMEITHRATDRAAFARGALFAAGWLLERPAGLYDMQSALGESQP